MTADQPPTDGPGPDSALALLINDLNQVLHVTSAVMIALPHMGEDQIAQTRDYAEEIGHASWRIVCACDAEALRRSDQRTRAEQVASYAAQVGSSPRTVYQNAQIQETYFTPDAEGLAAGSNHLDVLPDKSFYVEALRAPDPHQALAEFAELKTANPHFSRRDARMAVDRGIKERRVRAAQTDPLTTVRFPILYADPPWTGTGTRYLVSDGLEEDMCSLPVVEIAQDAALLFLWVPNFLLPSGLTVLSAWGFTYVGNVAWVKDTEGSGTWTRTLHELLLIGRRGPFPAPDPLEGRVPPSVLAAPRQGNAQKPQEVYRMIEAMYPDLARVTVFAQGEWRDGWTRWMPAGPASAGDQSGTGKEITE